MLLVLLWCCPHRLHALPQVPAPSSWADGTAPEKVLKALEGLHSEPNADTEAMRFAISVSELQPDTGVHAAGGRGLLGGLAVCV